MNLLLEIMVWSHSLNYMLKVGQSCNFTQTRTQYLLWNLPKYLTNTGYLLEFTQEYLGSQSLIPGITSIAWHLPLNKLDIARDPTGLTGTVSGSHSLLGCVSTPCKFNSMRDNLDPALELFPETLVLFPSRIQFNIIQFISFHLVHYLNCTAGSTKDMGSGQHVPLAELLMQMTQPHRPGVCLK